MNKLTSLFSLSFLAATVLATGCVLTTSFDPLSSRDNSSLTVTWTVDGAAPTAASCEALDIKTVRMRIFEEVGTTDFTSAALEEPCEKGGMGPINILADTYRLQFEGINADGMVVQRAPSADINDLASIVVEANQDKPVNVNFGTGSNGGATGFDVTASFENGFGSASFDGCVGGAVKDVMWSLKDGTTEVASGSQACATAAIEVRPTNALEDGKMYTLDISATNASGNDTWSGSTTLTAGAGNVAATIDVGEIAAPSLELTLTWETAKDSGSFVDCATLGTAIEFGWRVDTTPAAIPAVPFKSEGTCLDTLSATPAPGDYGLELQTTSSGDKWGEAGSGCESGLVVSHGKTSASCKIVNHTVV